MGRLTERNPGWLGEEFWTSAREPDDGEIDDVYERLKHYEDLEEELQKSFPLVTIEDFIDITLKHIQGKDDEIRIGRILTNYIRIKDLLRFPQL